ncbi:hypothetical protein HG537_0A03860 [Torulaspora globosa]|uniref:Uncharacterized protein n=1 Tax=Torulaspora globosa TaxID=48254 RepID=A0A7H9HLE0_9SACH|nr:hypothetical protein HG537_0A03860 [Torulaspora sp. CBS 2947]
MTSLYEYKHPIINKQLASSSDDHSGRKFPSLNAWYNVVNDYEFQARCPIILKNSHRNKHFTFACHLKDCPFKVLLSYCGNQRGLDSESSGEQHELNHSLVSLERKPKLEEEKQSLESEGDGRKYSEADAEDDDVSAAIAAAVAAVQDVRQKDGQFGEEYGSPGRGSENGVRGPFVVTKIEPYHNHPLESNLSLSKFVLTKVPRILQHDLNFDQILESLCNEDDNTVSKFRVSQYVEESGLLDILKERYGLTEAEIDKKLLSHISRRVTTYKARFVLKKKKNGEYGNPAAARGQNGSNGHAYARHSRSATMDHLGHGNGVADHGDSSRVNGRHLQSLHDGELNDAEVQAAQAAAQAAMGEAVALKRSVQQMVSDEDDEDGSRKRHMMKLSASMGGSLVNDDGSLVALDDAQDDKLPRDVAEQLRLLSSHFKEVEAHNLNNSEPDEETKLVVKDDIPDENIQPELRGQ